MTTKEKISFAALGLFNTHGVINVRLQQIADDIVISVGNLAYHYANKELIVLHHFDGMQERQVAIFDRFKIVPLFEYMDEMWDLIYTLQKGYQYFFTDALEVKRNYPSIGEKFGQYMSHLEMQLLHLLQFNMARGALIPLSQETLDQLATIIQQELYTWFFMQSVKGNKHENVQLFKEQIWALIRPYFSKQGSLEYKQMKAAPYDDFFQ